MQLMGIGQVAEQFGISTRTLRYYEQIGLLPSTAKTEAGYRQYGDEQIRRLKQIVVLRRLYVPLKDIGLILQDPANREAIAAFEENIAGLDSEIASMQQVRDILQILLDRIKGTGRLELDKRKMADAELAGLLMLRPLENARKKEATSMNHEKATHAYRDGDVRILYLPPVTVASAHIVGGEENEPEEATYKQINEFVDSASLFKKKPDTRLFGFNHPNGDVPEYGPHGYERWVTIPEDLDVPAPLTKKHFEGGLYAARTIPFGAFDEWSQLHAWVTTNAEYEPRLASEEVMSGLMEEELDFIHIRELPYEKRLQTMQLDLLYPVGKKEE